MNTLGFKWDNNEKGAVLIISILVLAAVSALGVVATRSATTELRMAAHDKAYKMTWFFTDALVSEMSPILLEKNFTERAFGAESDPLPITLTGASNNLEFYTRDFWYNVAEGCEANIPSPTNRDITMAPSGLAGGTRVDLRIFNNGGTPIAGSSWLMVEGYMGGAGKSLAGRGMQFDYTIRGLGQGPLNSQARVSASYRLIP